MDIKKFEKQLSKINNVFSAIAEEGEANSIERDLLKSYILKLYESFVETDQNESSNSSSKSSKTVSKSAGRKKTAKKQKPEPVIIEKVVEKIVKVVEEPVVVETPKAQAKPQAVKPVVETIAEPDGNMASLFEDFNNADLGDKLSQRAIKDLTKAWSINEKVFTIKELFAGDSDSFRQTVRELNDLADFDAAKKYLMKGVAEKYNWSEEPKFKKARNFIKQIKRRYN